MASPHLVQTPHNHNLQHTYHLRSRTTTPTHTRRNHSRSLRAILTGIATPTATYNSSADLPINPRVPRTTPSIHSGHCSASSTSLPAPHQSQPTTRLWSNPISRPNTNHTGAPTRTHPNLQKPQSAPCSPRTTADPHTIHAIPLTSGPRSPSRSPPRTRHQTHSNSAHRTSTLPTAPTTNPHPPPKRPEALIL